MNQTFTSANTSINSTKLPSVYSKIDLKAAWYEGMELFADYGCGKFNNAKDFIQDFGFEWLGYDKFNRTEEENTASLERLHYRAADLMVCSNVLNVIDNDSVIAEIARYILDHSLCYFVTVYEGDKSGNGRPTKDDCYQRNERIQEYLKHFPNAVIRKGVITNAPDLVK